MTSFERLEQAIAHFETLERGMMRKSEEILLDQIFINDSLKNKMTYEDCLSLAGEYRQLAAWLKELKRYKINDEES